MGDKWWLARACSHFLEKNLTAYIQKVSGFSLFKNNNNNKITEWILPHVVKSAPISGAFTFCTDINKLEMTAYKIGAFSKVVQSPFDSVQKSELFAILMVLFDFNETVNTIANS